MSRRSITDEAESQQKTENQEGAADTNTENDRRQLTQRMPAELVTEIDQIANSYGMSRNNTINMMCRQWLNDHE